MKPITTAILLALISLGTFYFFKSDPTKELALTTPLEIKPQEYMTQASVKIFEETGSLQEEISANYWAYLPSEQRSVLHLPYVTIYKQAGTTWTIQATSGFIKQPTLGTLEKIELQDKVLIKRLANKNNAPIKLTTQKLTYYPKTQFAENSELVTLTKPGLIITGIGLRAFLEKASVELLQEVKTHYLLQ